MGVSTVSPLCSIVQAGSLGDHCYFFNRNYTLLRRDLIMISLSRETSGIKWLSKTSTFLAPDVWKKFHGAHVESVTGNTWLVCLREERVERRYACITGKKCSIPVPVARGDMTQMSCSMSMYSASMCLSPVFKSFLAFTQNRFFLRINKAVAMEIYYIFREFSCLKFRTGQ